MVIGRVEKKVTEIFFVEVKLYRNANAVSSMILEYLQYIT